MSEKATLIIRRDSAQDMKMRAAEFLIDGVHVATLNFGQRWEGTIPAGRHTLTATNRAFSSTMEFVAETGETVEIKAHAYALGGLWLFFSMLGTIAFKIGLERSA